MREQGLPLAGVLAAHRPHTPRSVGQRKGGDQQLEHPFLAFVTPRPITGQPRTLGPLLDRAVDKANASRGTSPSPQPTELLAYRAQVQGQSHRLPRTSPPGTCRLQSIFVGWASVHFVHRSGRAAQPSLNNRYQVVDKMSARLLTEILRVHWWVAPYRRTHATEKPIIWSTAWYLLAGLNSLRRRFPTASPSNTAQR